MRVLVAPDKWKGCLAAAEVAAALASGLRRGLPGAEVEVLPVADGGEGTLDLLLAARGGARREVRVTGPLGEPVAAAWGLLGDGRTAVVEAAAACGLSLVPPGRRDPGATTTRGVGELLRAALDAGAEEVVVGLGGSATNDGGAGALAALGARLLDDAGRDLPPGGAALARLARLDPARLPRGARVRCACDVATPLLGPQGASRRFGPQKGAAPAQVEALDGALGRWAEVAARDLPGAPSPDLPGAGAAGGLGWGLAAGLGAALLPGAELVLDLLGADAALARADLLVVSEGRLDATTADGKAPWALARRAARRRVPVVAIAGQVADEALALVGPGGLTAAVSVAPGPGPLDDALREAPARLARTAEQVGRLVAAGAMLALLSGGRP